MELKEYIKIIKSNKLLFFGIWLAVIFLAVIWYKSRPISYEASMSVEVTRLAHQETQDYQFDQYYRIEADNKFSDTIVQWLKDPSVVSSILEQADINIEGKTLKHLSKAFTAEKLSANYVQVKYQSPQKKVGENISRTIQQVLSGKVEGLNKDTQSNNWFKLVYGDPIISQARINLLVVLAVAILGGFILAIMGVLLKHYWQD